MTTYDQDEKSVQGALPIELYTIATPTTIYYLTSYSANVLFGGTTYNAVPISRDNAVTGGLGQVRELTVHVSLDQPVAQDLLVGGIPQRDVTVTITRYMQTSGATRGFWSGHVSAISTDGLFVLLTVPNKMDDTFAVRLPIAMAQRACTHALYDPGCRLSRSNPTYFVSTAVVSVSLNVITVVVMNGVPDQWAKFGEIVRGSDGDRRSVTAQIGNTLTVDVPFRTLNPNDPVTVYAGCDHLPTTCRDKFFDPDTGLRSNIANFGGIPNLPTVNVMAPTGYGVSVQA